MNFGDKAAELAGIASALLGWKPDEFWSSTPAELATALGLSGDDDPQMDRDKFERLRARFPDIRGR